MIEKVFYRNLKSLKSNNLTCLFRVRDYSGNPLWNAMEQRLQRKARPSLVKIL